MKNGFFTGIPLMALVFGLLFIGCDDGSGDTNPTTTTTVYIAGYYDTGSYYNDEYGYWETTSTPCYWKDGVKIDLPIPAGAKTYFLDYNYNIIAVRSNGDVYILGYYYYDGGTSTSCYWKNGVRTDLSLSVPAGTYESFVFSIAVSANGDVYIAGGCSYSNYDDNIFLPCYWKNGVRTDLPLPVGAVSDPGMLYSLAISSSGDVYIASHYYVSDTDDTYTQTYTPCYWKNGVRTDLSVPAGADSYTTDIAISSNGDVYILGCYYDSDTGAACYWKNGVRTDLPVPAGAESYAYAIAVSSNGDVYNAGGYFSGSWDDDTHTSTACYWKNGVRTDLPVPAGAESYTVGIAVASNGDVHILGGYSSGSWDDNTYTYTACYWKNGVRTDLLAGANAYGIAVVTQ